MSFMSIMSIIRFETKPGMEESFLSAFNEGTEFERQQEVEGFQSSVMCRLLEDNISYEMLSRLYY